MSDFPTDFTGFEGPPPLPARRARSDATTRAQEHGPGWFDYRKMRSGQTAVHVNRPGFHTTSSAGVQKGRTKAEAEQLWDQARILARHDMELIKKAFPSTDEIVEEATMTLLTNIRGPVDDAIKLASAKTLLEFYKQKPKATRDITVNTFETWLETIDAPASDRTE